MERNENKRIWKSIEGESKWSKNAVSEFVHINRKIKSEKKAEK